ncbi:unnamed protein product [Brassicogethes aeneus]|uniref:DUF4806 domain-containing protein n=1 Tax=Brassicogethes aeneus TaxID=1431903 RepID=A0A9P0AW24_BRAAE|nr:unnamed protein product [Brassicogethes aeneus]
MAYVCTMSRQHNTSIPDYESEEETKYVLNEHTSESNNKRIKIDNIIEDISVVTGSNIHKCIPWEHLDCIRTIQNQQAEIIEQNKTIQKRQLIKIEQNKTTQRQLAVLIEQNETIIEQNQVIINETSQLKEKEDKQLSENLLDPPSGFPLTTLEQFDELNSDLNMEGRRQLYKYLINCGGTTLREFLNRALKIIMTDELVCNFTWLGDKTNRGFGNTKVSNVLKQAAQKCLKTKGPQDIDHFKKEMLEVLRVSKQRHRLFLKKTSETNSRITITKFEEVTYNELY